MQILKKIFGDPNVKTLKSFQKTIQYINSLEPELKKVSDEQLKARTEEFRQRLKNGETLDDILAESFATVREAAQRTLGQRHYDVQLMAGIALHQRSISEMKTGEGKTLAATAPLYLNALEGKGVHLVTVNDYLARRDADWMGRVFHFLGMSVGCIQHEAAFLFDPEIAKEEKKEDTSTLSFRVDANNLRPVNRREAYNADITYGTNNEFGFDYLRDNMVQSLSQKVQRELNYSIIDEVDSILIDEARTPLIISAPAQEATERYYKFAQIVSTLKENEHYNVDEKMHAASLTQKGIDVVEQMLGQKDIYQEGGIEEVHHVEQALKAKTLFKNDRDYVVKEEEVIIVDEFTGRLMYGRRFSEGLHQAIEAKEGLPIKQESLTLATITLQNLFRLYKKLAGMTGTAETEAEEFGKIYGLDVVVIPTNKDMIRDDAPDKIYKNEVGKFKAVISDIKERNAQGQPVLVGTISIQKNELLSSLLQAEGIPHEVLNAKNHEREAQIIAQAGKKGAVTVATNMAGRGVDIVLGGNPVNPEEANKVREAGGVAVIGTERHESRRIDNQLRGRSGRQGDAGASQFYVSMDDDLMRIFGSNRMKSLMERMGLPEDMPIQNKVISRSIESAQKRVEGRNFDIRKHLVEYDDVMNKHREVIYKRRNEILKNSQDHSEKLREEILEMIEHEIEQVVSFHTAADEGKKNWDIQEIFQVMRTIFPLSEKEQEEVKKIGDKNGDKVEDVKIQTDIIQQFIKIANVRYKEFEEKFEDSHMLRDIEKAVLLRAIDTLWIDHLDQMTRLREGIGLRGYGQKDPLVEYKKESYELFTQLLNAIQHQVVYSIYKVVHRIQAPSIMKQPHMHLSAPAKEMDQQSTQFAQYKSGSTQTAQQKQAIVKLKDKEGNKVGRNDPCPCGSGKKYKKCHGVV